MTINWIASLEEKSGRSVEQWIALVRKNGPKGEEERRTWLKKAHGLGTNSARWIAERACNKGGEIDTPEAYLAAAGRYVDTMYSGKKAAIRPIHDRLIEVARGLGKDVRICPCKTMVPLYRHHVFAEIKPATNTRVDLGLALKDTRPTGRLVDAGGAKKKDRITLRIPLTSPNDIDAEVRRWLAKAYEMDG